MLFLTSNEGKFREVESIVDADLKRKSIELEEIQAIEVEDVIEHKLEEAYDRLKEPVIVEDTGLFFEDWGRLPGALTKFFMKALGNEKLCSMLGENRKAAAETYVGYKDGGVEKIFKGVIKGKIADRPRGEGFGWDPIFQPEGYGKTFGEMSQEEKNQISMRKKAFENLDEWLQTK
ncbi:MAG: non-canonical purine NTP pyrophosphatase [Candidatus Aenigmatarchaeota archaeon]